MELLDDVPRMIKVRQELGSLHIKLPRRHSAKSSSKINTLLAMAGLMMVTTCGGALGQGVFTFVTEVYPELLWVALPAFLSIWLLPYIGIFTVMKRAGAPGEVVINQRMLKMEGRGALTLPLEEVRGVEIVHDGDQGRLLFDTTHGEVPLFDGLYHHELAWLHRVVESHSGRLREQMQDDGYDTDVVARPPEAIQQLIK